MFWCSGGNSAGQGLSGPRQEQAQPASGNQGIPAQRNVKGDRHFPFAPALEHQLTHTRGSLMIRQVTEETQEEHVLGRKHSKTSRCQTPVVENLGATIQVQLLSGQTL